MGTRLSGPVCFAAVAAVVLAGCSSGAAKQPAPTTSIRGIPSTTTAAKTVEHFVAPEGAGLAFDHPAVWPATLSTENVGTFGHPIVYLSNARLKAPCTTTSSATDVTTNCGYPIRVLPPGGVLVTWGGYVTLNEPQVQHPNTTVSGKSASVTTQRPGNCSMIGAQETITADIAHGSGHSGGYFQMVACLRGPNLTRDEGLVRQMLHSVRITSGAS